MQTALDILKAIDEKFSSSERWTQQKFAGNASGDPVCAKDKSAVCWCVEGAVMSLDAFNQPHMDALSLLNEAAEIPLWNFNDSPGRSFQEIKLLISKAISLASKK